MTLMISNAEVARLLTMPDTIAALETSYRQLVTKESVCRPRIDIQIPTSQEGKVYQWGSMEGGSVNGYFAVRIKSDIVYEQTYNGVRTQEKFCGKPGQYCGLILLVDTETALPVAIINDGVLQHMRVGADGGIGVKFMSREDSHVVGILGSGGMARSHVDAFVAVRNIQRIQVYSPTPANRERFAEEIREKHGVEVVVHDNPQAVYKGADILAGLTDSAVPVINAEWIEPGTHVLNVGGRGQPAQPVLDRIDLYLRFGSAPGPWGLPQFAVDDEFITYAARPDYEPGFTLKPRGSRGHGSPVPEKTVSLADIIEGRAPPRTRDLVTYSERGNLQGAQFWAVAARVYELAKAEGVEREIPTEWLLQDIRD